MEVYLSTILLIFLFAFFELRCKLTVVEHTIMASLLYVVIVLQVGLRWETGTDWSSYYNNFLNTTDINIVFVNSLIGFELGYGLFSFFIRSLTDSYTVFLLSHAILYYFLIFKANKRLSPFPFLSLLLFYVTNIGVLGSNRQLLALAICLYALKFVIEKKPIKFFILVFVAFLFHTTALLFMVYYFLNRDFKKYQIIVVLVLAFIIGKTTLPNILFSGLGSLLGGASASKVDVYSAASDVGDASLSLIGLVRRLIYFVLFIVNYDMLTAKFKEYKLLFNGFLFGLVFYFLFSNSLLILVNRGSLYFNVMEVFLLSSQLLIFQLKTDRKYILLLLLIYSIYLFFQAISGYPDLFVPYKGIFINSDFKRNLY
ncbi:EpsG family protein [Flavobacterium sp. ACAM 123]|uniref:EpsG family protein n=1 Tax=Flavobacterium sp. ACAM 123 TaxID=1189620 RepID=UPI0002F9ABB6|nr:EpsG family protein [Flavobacterium sp. ACAM 123]